jgi:hypothetical protein
MRRLITMVTTVALLLFVAVTVRAEQTRLTFDDGNALLKGTLAMSQDSAARIFVMKDSAAQMPAFDPLAYYVGNDKSGHPIVWMNNNPAGTYVGETFMSMAGVLFAAMDHGYAGGEWKARYDAAAAADKALPAGAPNPFANRHALLAQLDAIWKAPRAFLFPRARGPGADLQEANDAV